MVAFADHGDGINTFELLAGLRHRRKKVRRGLGQMHDEMHDDFGVGVGRKNIAMREQHFTQRDIVFDDAVMHDGDSV